MSTYFDNIGGKIMKFSQRSKGCEVAIIMQLLPILGAVEERQLRLLFSHLTNKQYGQVLYRLQREDAIYRTADARYLSTSKMAFERTNIVASVWTFWAFIHMKDKVGDFCAGNPPAVLSFSSKGLDCDLIPVIDNRDEINSLIEGIPAKTLRFLIAGQEKDFDGLTTRPHEDFGIIIDSMGVKSILKL
jgi:glutaredoxin-related protein